MAACINRTRAIAALARVAARPSRPQPPAAPPPVPPPPIVLLYIIIYKRLSSVQQEVFTHRHDRHLPSVNKAVARVVEVRWLMKKSKQVPQAPPQLLVFTFKSIIIVFVSATAGDEVVRIISISITAVVIIG
jgi:hypothetical protein